MGSTAEKFAHTLEMLNQAATAHSLNAIASQLLLCENIKSDKMFEFNDMVATYLYGSSDVRLSDVISYLSPLELTPNCRSIVDYHIWVLKQQPQDQFPEKTV